MTSAVGSVGREQPVQLDQLTSPNVAQNLSDSLIQGTRTVGGKDLVARGAMLTRASRSIRNLFVACKNFGVYTCTTVKLLARRSVIPIAFAAALACVPGMPRFPVLLTLNGG
jgi:hypothetical protein